MRVLRALSAIALSASMVACGGGEVVGTVNAIRDTLPDGTPIVHYTALGSPETVADLQPDLTLGSVDGVGPDVFGDVRGIEAGPGGEIFVLDAQALEVRVFGPDGAFLRTLSRDGEGPGELGGTNGMVRVADTLFVYDHAKWMILGLSVDDGRELVRYPTPVRSYGFIWTGVRDDQGRHWKPTAHSDRERVYPPEPGLLEGSSRNYWKVYDPSNEAVDSVAVGSATVQSWVQPFGSGFSYRQIPFRAGIRTIVDPVGGFWQVATEAYRIARMDASGDTTLIVEAAVQPRPVSTADRNALVDAVADREPDVVRATTDMLEHLPSIHPVVRSTFIAADRLWVTRTTADGDRARVDVFDPEGGYRGSVRLPAGASEYLAPRIRGNHMYLLVQDELGIPYVVRSPLPEGLVDPSGGD